MLDFEVFRGSHIIGGFRGSEPTFIKWVRSKGGEDFLRDNIFLDRKTMKRIKIEILGKEVKVTSC